MGGLNWLVRLNYLLFFGTVLNFIADVDPNFARASASLYKIAMPESVKETLEAAWPYGFGTFLHFITGIVLTLNLYVMQQMIDHPQRQQQQQRYDGSIRFNNCASNCNSFFGRSPGMPQQLFTTTGDGASSRGTSHITDYIKENVPKKMPPTSGRISFSFPEPPDWLKKASAGNIPRPHQEIVMLPKDQLDKIEPTDHGEEVQIKSQQDGFQGSTPIDQDAGTMLQVDETEAMTTIQDTVESDLME